jgi:5,10-methylenetetrahydrofolate reductase
MVTSRILFTAKQKDELWERWKNGQSVLAISRALERRNKTGVQRIVALHGGIASAQRRRAVAALRLELLGCFSGDKPHIGAWSPPRK